MLRKNIPFLLRFFFVLLVVCGANAQIYLHDFGTTTINTHPYAVAPAILNTNLSNSSWTNSTGSWSSNGGASGQALQIFTPSGSTTATLTFNVAPDFQANILSFSFWSRRSNSGPVNWQLSLNGAVAGNGTVTTAGASTGLINVTGDFSGLTGTVTVELTLSNATGGNIRIDDFALFGSVISTCPVTVISFAPAAAPAGTIVTINGTGFTGTSAVKFNNITSPSFTVISDTVLKAEVPAGNSDGTIVVTSGCMAYSATAFTLLETECAAGTDVFISEVYDAQAGSPGAIELYNPTPSTINFSGQYVLERYGTIGDGSPTSGYVLTLPGSIGPGQTYLINSGPAPCGITPVSQLGNGINASDELKLKKNGTVIDVVQAIGEVGYTFIRKPNANVPSPVYNSSHWNISNNESCSNLGVHTINSAVAPTVTNPADQATCQNGMATFTVTVTPATGAVYQWKIFNGTAWVNVANGPNYSGAASGTLTISNVSLSFDNNQYYCQVTTSSCTIVSSAVQLSVSPAAAEPQLDIQQPDCITTTTGTVTIVSPVGAGYTYSINNGTYQPGASFNNLAPGIYTITAKDPSGCTSLPADVIINPSSLPVADATILHPDCLTPTGTITINSPIGAGLTYSLDGVIFQTGTTFSGIAPGTYSIIVQNAGGCTSSASGFVIDPVPTPPAVATTTIIQPTCSVATGTITVTNPVSAAYTYSLDGITYQSNTLFSGLAPGNYSITVKNEQGCTSVTPSLTINAVPAPPQVPTVTTIQPECQANGKITVTTPVGAGHTYSINGTNYQSSPVFNNVVAGTYQLTVKSNGCVSDALEVTLINADAPLCIQNPNLLDNVLAPSSDPHLGSKGTWFTSHGTPSGAPGSVWMWSYSGNGEGMYTCYNFESGKQYKVCVTIENDNAPGTIGYTNPDALFYIQASNGNFLPRPTPPGNQIIAGWHAIDQSPADYSFTFTANDNYTKLWLFPHMQQHAPTGADQYMILVYSVKVEEVLTNNPVASLTGNTVTVNDSPQVAGHWEWLPAGLVASQNADGTEVTVNPSCNSSQLTGTFVSNCQICTDYTVQVNLPGATVPEPVTNVTQTTCSNTIATITVFSPSGAGFSYSLDGGAYQSSATFNNVSTGNHTVTAQNPDGCTSTPATVIVNPVPSVPVAATASIIHPTCSASTGSVTITVPTGTGLTYSLDGGTYQSSILFDNVISGNHTLLVQNAEGCISAPATVIVNPVPSVPAVATANVVHPICTTPTGSITITSPLGAGLTYSLDGGTYQSSPIFNNVTPGNHTITVQNTDGCLSIPATVTVNPVPVIPLPAIAAVTQPTCATPTGTITISSPVGAGLTYSLDGGAYQSTVTFNDIAPGNHIITVQNADGCISSPATATVNPVPPVPVVALATVTHPTCTATTGSITITSPIGTGLTYSLDGGPYQSSPTFSNIAAGNHSITVQGASGCLSAPATFTVNPVPSAPAPATTDVIHPTCTVSTGNIIIVNPLGTGLSYSLDGGTYQSSATFNSVTSGNHTITVKNAEGCISSPVTVTVNPVPLTPSAAVSNINHPTCATPTGSITIVNPIGAGLTYSLDGGTYQSAATFNNVAPGNHIITVQHQNGCVSNSVNVVVNPVPSAPVAATINIAPPTCTVSTGSITVTNPIGAGLTYSVDGGPYQPSVTFNNIAPGNHTITVQGAVGCFSVPTAFNINSVPFVPPAATANVDHPTCTSTIGTITITGPLGPGLTYSLDGGIYQSSLTFNNVSSGNHTIIVQNPGGCTSAPVAVIINPVPSIPANPVVSALQPTCILTTGQITVSSPTGVGYQYSIDGINYQNSTAFTNLVPGTYTITVRNTAGCTSVSGAVTINNPPTPAPDPGIIVGSGEICLGDTTILSNIVTGGIWSSSNAAVATIDSNGVVTGVSPGTAVVRYTVGTICTDWAEITIMVNPLPNPVLYDTYLCKDPATGGYPSILLNSGLSSAQYSFVWKKGGTVLPDAQGYLSVFEPGTYSVTATSLTTGCTSQTVSATVGVSSIATATAEVHNDFDYRQSIHVLVTGGSGSYVYSLDGGPFQTSPVFTDIYEGEYIITVNDINGCGTTTFTVFALNYPRYFSPNDDGYHDFWNIDGLRQQRNAHIHIFDRYGKVVASIKPSGIGWDGTYNGNRLPATDYWFTVYYTSSNGQQKEFKAHFSLMR